MPQVTIYINNSLEEHLKSMANALGISPNELITDILERKFKYKCHPSVKQLAGAWKDFPSLEEIRENSVQDTAREPF